MPSVRVCTRVAREAHHIYVSHGLDIPVTHRVDRSVRMPQPTFGTVPGTMNTLNYRGAARQQQHADYNVTQKYSRNVHHFKLDDWHHWHLLRHLHSAQLFLESFHAIDLYLQQAYATHRKLLRYSSPEALH